MTESSWCCAHFREGLIRIRTVHLISIIATQPYRSETLGPSYPPAQELNHLRLLPSGPDRVHGRPSRRTLPSTRQHAYRNLHHKT